MATTSVTLNGFQLIGATPAGGRAKVTGFDGWLSAKNDRTRGRRSGQHGSYSSRSFREEDPIALRGEILYADPAIAAAERRALVSLGGFGETQLVVTDSLGTLGIAVEVDDVSVTPMRDTYLRFAFSLTAKDPFARATTASTVSVAAGASVVETAAGQSAAEIEVTTTSTGTVDLKIGSLRLRWGSLPSGSVLTSGKGFPNRQRTVVGPTGANLFGLIVQPMQWPAMSPGANTIVNAGTADLDIRYFPTY
jgi:hypothetical protein